MMAHELDTHIHDGRENADFELVGLEVLDDGVEQSVARPIYLVIVVEQPLCEEVHLVGAVLAAALTAAQGGDSGLLSL